MFRPEKIISGGQTGADIGGLVGAKRAGIKTGGTAPRGFKTEKGPQPEALAAFGLVSHPSPNYRDRTLQNVADSNATLIFATDSASDGTKLTIEACEKQCKPYAVIDPNSLDASRQIIQFMEIHKPNILNVAGNRESKSPGISIITARLIEEAFKGSSLQ